LQQQPLVKKITF